jgi:hypothetical protein
LTEPSFGDLFSFGLNVWVKADKGKISTSLPIPETLSCHLMMGKRKTLNGESSDGVAVAEDSGSDEVGGPPDTNSGPTPVGLFCTDLIRTLTHWMWTLNGSIHSQSTTFTASRPCYSSFSTLMLIFLSSPPSQISSSRSHC